MVAEYDIFLSHAWADGERPKQLADALTNAGLRVWFDANEINDFASITRAVTEGLAKSKTLLAYYSKTYPLRRACQWELTAAFLAAQAEGDPRRRVMVVSPEEKPDHIHPIELRDAKFRNAPKDEGEMGEVAEAIRKHIGTVEGPLADISPLTAPNWYGMTPVGSTRFVGRLKEMWEVHSLLHAGDVAQVSYAASATGGIGRISGLGGVGKSLLAEEYALHFGAAYPGGVFWVRAYGNDDAKAALGPEQREALRSDQVRQIAERMGIDTRGATAEQIEGALSRKIATEGKPCLWVVDDVPNGLDGEALRRWFAPHALARTLLTTRSGEYGSLTKGIDLSVLTPDEAFQLLTSRRTPMSKNEEEQARELAKDLGYHALALDVTASALVSSVAAEPFSDFRGKLTRPDKDALALAETLADVLPNGHEKSIAQTMLRSIRGLGTEGLDFLRLASVLAVAPIPASLVTAVFEEVDKLSHDDAEERASLGFRQVTSASLAEITGEQEDARSVHTLVSRAVRFHEKSAPERIQALRAAAVDELRAAIAKAAEDPRLHKQIEFQVAHARQVVAMPATASEADLVGWTAKHDYARGAYASAQMLYERRMDFCGRMLGPEHPDTLTSIIAMGETLRRQGSLPEALRLERAALDTLRQVQGREHPDTLALMSNLALTLHDQGELEAARALMTETLSIQRRVLGLEHPLTLISMNSLGYTLLLQGDLTGGRRLLEETLALRQKVLGPEHPQTLTSAHNLALILREQGDLSAAKRVQKDMLDTKIRVLGAEHPSTLISMAQLAVTLSQGGDLQGSRKLEEETLAIQRRVLGPDHPDTLVSLSNLAVTLDTMGDLVASWRLKEETLDTQRRVLGPDHPSTSISAWNLVVTLLDLEKYIEARAVLERDLLWLLDRDPATLGADQRKIREYVAQVVKESG